MTASFIPKLEEAEADEGSDDSGRSPSVSGCVQAAPKRTNSCCSLYAFSHNSTTGRTLTWLSRYFLAPHTPVPIGHCQHTKHGAAFVAFLSLLLVTFANNMLSPMRDAAALALGVGHIPNLTLASTLLAFCSSVPMGWLFEAPNPERKGRRWRDKVGLTRGETQGTSLALFYRIFAILLLGYALAFQLVDWVHSQPNQITNTDKQTMHTRFFHSALLYTLLNKFWAIFYIAFYLVGNLMKLYSVSLLWGVASEAMEYEEQAEARLRNYTTANPHSSTTSMGRHPFTSTTSTTHYAPSISSSSDTPQDAQDKQTQGKRSRYVLEPTHDRDSFPFFHSLIFIPIEND
jgi:hypothetical protein